MRENRVDVYQWGLYWVADTTFTCGFRKGSMRGCLVARAFEMGSNTFIPYYHILSGLQRQHRA